MSNGIFRFKDAAHAHAAIDAAAERDVVLCLDPSHEEPTISVPAECGEGVDVLLMRHGGHPVHEQDAPEQDEGLTTPPGAPLT